jgi:anti-anti-sigma regulatory factor
MSFHFCSHAWEVQDLADGTVIRLRNRDLDAESIPVLVDDLFVLAKESGKPNLYLDFGDIGLVSSEAMGRLAALKADLREQGLQLVLMNLNPGLQAPVISDQ